MQIYIRIMKTHHFATYLLLSMFLRLLTFILFILRNHRRTESCYKSPLNFVFSNIELQVEIG